MRSFRRRSTELALGVLFALGCHKPSATPPDSDDGANLPAPTGKTCIVHLHGKGGHGAPTRVEDRPSPLTGLTHLYPEGNAAGWDGRQWLYFPQNRYDEVRDRVGAAIRDAGCGRVVLHGFSNGASAAAKLYCSAERFGNTLVGVIADDPVPDQGVVPCRRPRGVPIRLYSTGALKQTSDGWSCAKADFTCEGGSTIGIAHYAEHLGTTVVPSIHATHEVYAAPPEYTAW